jgi:uncharacterized protein YihD (DUF1040 family)
LKADGAQLKRKVYNMAGISFNPEQLSSSIKKMMPEFKVDYEPDFRQKIADAWPKSIDDSESKKDWGWSYDVTVDDLAKKIMNGIHPDYKKDFKMHI